MRSLVRAGDECEELGHKDDGDITIVCLIVVVIAKNQSSSECLQLLFTTHSSTNLR